MRGPGNGRRAGRHPVWPGLLLAALALAACESPEPPVHLRVVGGDPDIGRRLVADYGCGTCHVVPRVRGAAGTVGPPLTDLALRSYIAGSMPNRPDVLTRFLEDPPSVQPRTAMPNLGVTPEEARHIAAFLYTLR
jgi:cytochrome c